MRLTTKTEGNTTTYSTYVRLLHALMFSLNRRIERILDRSWNKEHGPHGEA